MPRAHDVGGFDIHRAFPAKPNQMVGPFIFFDHIGPAIFISGAGIDVRPHPHIGLATLTYLFDGEIIHPRHAGHPHAAIRPGEVNWMTAGRGIRAFRTHRPRTIRAPGTSRSMGLQCWVALPAAREEPCSRPSRITAASEFPDVSGQGTSVRVAPRRLGCTAARSPVRDRDRHAVPRRGHPRGRPPALPIDAGLHEEAPLYITEGEVDVQEASRSGAGRLLAIPSGRRADTARHHAAARL